MIAVSAAATEAARRLWAESAAGADTTETMVAAAERVCAALATGLVRWIGRDGYHSLLLRALEQVLPAHRWLANLRCEEGRVHGLAAGAPGHTAADVADGMLALIAMVVHVLGRITGEEMAIRLVEQAWTANAPATPIAEATGVESTKGTHHG